MKKLILTVVTTLVFITLSYSQSCLPDGITFSTQEQIDNFQINYPDCKEIEGDVLIEGNDISNLIGLNVLTSFGGDLNFNFCDLLTNLTGLDNVTSIGGHLSIRNNVALTSQKGLDNVTSIGEGLTIKTNVALRSLSGLENVTSIGGSINIYDNDLLKSLTGLEGLISFGGSIDIYNNAALTSLSGLDNVTSIWQSIEIYYNPALISLAGLGNLTSIKSLYIVYNNNLTSLTDLYSVDSIRENLVIRDNIALNNLTGLDNVTSIGGYLKIEDNKALTSLSELSSVTTLGGHLFIRNNVALTSLTGLDNIDAGTIDFLFIHDNISLSTCEVKSVCDYLGIPNEVIEIYDNSTGCNSQEEVEEACTVSVDENTFSTSLIIKPNPFTTTTTIEYQLDQPTEITITIFNHLGKQVELIRQYQQQGKQQVVWNAVGLPAGMYFFTLKAGEQVAIGKIVLVR